MPFLSPAANGGNCEIKVNGVETHPDGSAMVGYICSGVDMSNYLDNFFLSFESLRDQVREALSRCGEDGLCHWGADVDFAALAKEFDIGFILLCRTRRPTDSGHGLAGWAYPLNVCRKSFSHWLVLIYFDKFTSNYQF